MARWRLKCRICKTVETHKELNDFKSRLPDSVIFVECLSCGVLGVELAENATQLKDVGESQ